MFTPAVATAGLALSRLGSPAIGSALDPSTLIAVNAAAALSITTYVGGNNELVEPSVYFNPAGWNGYEYWMAAGPYENSSSAVENPSIWASHDGVTWIVPGTNPIAGPPGSGNYDDPHLVEVGGVLYLIFNWTNTVDTILMTSSADGVNWTTPVALLVSVNAGHEFLSPHVEYQAGVWHLWYLNILATRKIQHRTAATLTGTWSAPTDCTVPLPTAPAKDHWEFEVRRVGSEWWMLQCLVNVGQTAAGGVLYFRTSQDGITWNLAGQPVLAGNADNNSNFDANFIYKAGFVPFLNGRVGIWYSAGSTGTLRWRVGYTTAVARANLSPTRATWWYAPPCAVTAALLVQGSVEWLPQYFDRATLLTAIGLEITVVGSAGSVVELGIYADDGKGRPGPIIIDAGSIDGTSATFQSKAAAVTVGPGIVWWAAVGLGSPTTQPTVRKSNSSTGVPIGWASTTLPSQNALSGYKQTGLSALPALVSPASISSGVNNAARLLWQSAASSAT